MKNKLHLYGTYFSILFLILLAGYIVPRFTYKNVKEEIINRQNAQQFAYLNQATRGITHFLENHIEIIEKMAKNDDISNLNESGEKLMHAVFDLHQNEIRILARTNFDGIIICSEPRNLQMIGQTIKIEEFQKAKETNETVLGDIFLNGQNQVSIAIHTPVIKNGRFDGTLMMCLPLEYITNFYIDDIKIGADGYAWAINAKGVELSCPVPGHVGNSVFENCKDFPSILDMAEKMLQGEHGVTTYEYDQIREAVITKTTKHAVFGPVYVKGKLLYSIVVATSEAELLSSLQNFQNQLILVATILIAGMGFFFHRLFITRIAMREANLKSREHEFS